METMRKTLILGLLFLLIIAVPAGSRILDPDSNPRRLTETQGSGTPASGANLKENKGDAGVNSGHDENLGQSKFRSGNNNNIKRRGGGTEGETGTKNNGIGDLLKNNDTNNDNGEGQGKIPAENSTGGKSSEGNSPGSGSPESKSPEGKHGEAQHKPDVVVDPQDKPKEKELPQKEKEKEFPQKEKEKEKELPQKEKEKEKGKEQEKELPQKEKEKEKEKELPQKEKEKEKEKELPQKEKEKELPQKEKEKELPQKEKEKDLPQKEKEKDLPQKEKEKDLPPKEKEKEKEPDQGTDEEEGKPGVKAIKDGARKEVCDVANRCIDGNMVACIRAPGNEMEQLSLLIQNNGEGALHVHIDVPAFLKVDRSNLTLNKQEKEFVQVSSAGQVPQNSSLSKIVVNGGNNRCELDVHDQFFNFPIKQSYFQSFRYSSVVTPMFGVYFLLFTVLAIGGSWMCCKCRGRRRHGDGMRYQELEMNLPETNLSTNGRKPEAESLDGWDEVWDDSWEDAEAARSSLRPIQTLSSNGLAARRSNKDGWDSSWDD